MKINLRYIGLIFLVVILSCVIHEFGHYITGTLLGNHMGMTLNRTFPIGGEYQAPWQQVFVDSGGPVLSILQAVVALALIQWRGGNELSYLFLIEPVTLRIWPYLVSPLTSQDEARVGEQIGMNPWILPVIVWLILGVLAWFGVRRMNKRTKEIIVSVALILIAFQVVLRLNNFVVARFFS